MRDLNFIAICDKCVPTAWVGTAGSEPGRREGGKRESRGGGNQEKLGKFRNILLHFAIEMRGREEEGTTKERVRKGDFQTSLSLPATVFMS